MAPPETTRAQCPVRSSSHTPVKCPVSSTSINPRNNMPVESQDPAPDQSNDLPTTRVISSIPRTPDSMYVHQSNMQENWEYPSPQQFYNALLRKGWNMPERQMETMVHIHNRLNEDAWKLVLQWESRFHGGDTEAAKLELTSFSGIHGHLSNKARFYKFGRRFFPSRFTQVYSTCQASLPETKAQHRLPDPFDRHDWIVRRPQSGKQARYVIDYYGVKNARGDTQFVMDARPALDSFDNARMRTVAAIGRILGVVTSKIGRSADGALITCGIFLLAIGLFVYIRRL